MNDPSNADVSDEDILTVFAETEDDYLRPPDVAEDLPIPAEELRDRFDDLSERDLIRRDADRLSGTAYALTDEGASRLEAADEAPVTDVEAQATATGTASTTRDQETPESQPPAPGADTAGPPYEQPADAIEAFDPPGTPDQKEQRRAALRAAYEYLRDSGTASRSEFVESVFPNESGAYETPDDGWWADVVRPGLRQLPGPEPVEDTDEWQFDEDASARARET